MRFAGNLKSRDPVRFTGGTDYLIFKISFKIIFCIIFFNRTLRSKKLQFKE
jgi:hypothetical protein